MSRSVISLPIPEDAPVTRATRFEPAVTVDHSAIFRQLLLRIDYRATPQSRDQSRDLACSSINWRKWPDCRKTAFATTKKSGSSHQVHGGLEAASIAITIHPRS